MSDSSDNEDFSRFTEVVDNSFVLLLSQQTDGDKNTEKCLEEKKSERNLETAAHYNDVKVPLILQTKIGDKVSAIIHKNIEFVDFEDVKVKMRKVRGGVKLFKDSEDYLSCEDTKDTVTDDHNKKSKHFKFTSRLKNIEMDTISENDKISASVVTGSYVLSKEEIKYWKSRRKEKLFKYKSKGKSNVLIAVEDVPN